MYAFQWLLDKFYDALRPEGLLILRIPEPEDGWVEAIRQDEIVFTSMTNEATFNSYVAIGKSTLARNMQEGRFRRQEEFTFDFDYPYPSIQAWVDDNAPGCEDLDAFYELAERLRGVEQKEGALTLNVRYREWTILLRKDK